MSRPSRMRRISLGVTAPPHSTMFDVLGILRLGNDPEPLTATAAFSNLPSEEWARADCETVERPRVRARFLRYRFGPPSYATTDAMHLFLVGEMFFRGSRTRGPLGAPEILLGCQKDL